METCCRTYFCDPSLGLTGCFRAPSEPFVLEAGFATVLLEPLSCALSEAPEVGFAFEAKLVVEAIAGLSA